MDPYRFAPPDRVAKSQAKYVRLFTEIHAKKVLDLGCGRGIFLRLLRDEGIKGIGVDLAPHALDACRAEGLTVYQEDALTALQRFTDVGAWFDGVFCSHLIEHLPGDRAESLIARSAAVLTPRGRLVIITPNVEHLQVLTQGFWLDSSHVRFVPRLLLESLMADVGLRVIASTTDPETVGEWHAAHRLRKIVWRMVLGSTFVDRHLLSGLDALVIGERPASEGYENRH